MYQLIHGTSVLPEFYHQSQSEMSQWSTVLVDSADFLKLYQDIYSFAKYNET
jgi:hypothetical protein